MMQDSKNLIKSSNFNTLLLCYKKKFPDKIISKFKNIPKLLNLISFHRQKNYYMYNLLNSTYTKTF